MEDKERAGAEAEITPEMIEAGAAVLRVYTVWGADYSDLAPLVYEAMEKAKAKFGLARSSKDVSCDSGPDGVESDAFSLRLCRSLSHVEEHSVRERLISWSQS